MKVLVAWVKQATVSQTLEISIVMKLTTVPMS